MTGIVKIAWRNIWRNKRRSLITVASIFFAVFFAVLMRSMQLGTYGHMIKQSIEKFTGYLQLQNPEYFDDPSLDNFIEYSDELISIVKTTEGIRMAVPRIESFVLASSGHQSKGVLITGIDPEAEGNISNPERMLIKYRLTPDIVQKISNDTSFSKKQLDLLKFNQNGLYHDLDRLALDLGLNVDDFKPYHHWFVKYASNQGSYLEKEDKGILLASNLANYLRVQVGDTIVLMGQGKYGTSAAGLFPIRGLVKVPSPDLNNKLIYMSLTQAQEFFGMQGLVTSLVMNLDDTDDMLEVQEELNKKLNQEKYVVKNWEQIVPILKQQIEGDNTSGKMFVGILYFIVFFGIFGTVIMMIAERKREFGVLIAIGMRKKLLAGIVLIEMIFIGIIGTAAGLLAAMPIVIMFNKNPIHFTGEMAKMYEDMGFEAIMPTEPVGFYFVAQGLVILLMVLIACYIPLQRIRKMKIMDALRA